MCGRSARFNSYLCLAALGALVLAVSCKAPEERRQSKLFTHLWLHLQIPANYPTTNRVASARIAGVDLRVTTSPFITEADVDAAEVVETPGGGFGLKVTFNDHGRLALSTITTAERGRRMPIFADWGKRKSAHTVKRWLAAPVIARPIMEGWFVFTPDATREELNDIVRGLNNAAKRNKKAWVF